MIEKGTNYSFLIKAQQDLTFQKIKAVSEQFVRDLPQDLRETLLRELTGGPQIIETEPSMAAYLHTCGDVCEARLQQAFAHLPSSFFSREIEWIDYDGGQAIGAMVYHDFLKNRNIQQLVRRITLIHPSGNCLQRAALHAHQFFPQAEIRTVCKPVNVLQAEDISTDNSCAKLHLLMNIRNLDTISATHLAEVIQAGLSGYNQFICISPFYGESSEAVARLDAFVDSLEADAGRRFSENLAANRMVADKPWTCSLRMFTKGGTEDDVSDSMPDEEPAIKPAESLITDREEAEAVPENSETVIPAAESVEPDEMTETCAVREPEPAEPDTVCQLRIQAEQGNAKAQNNLGFLYEMGQDVPQDDIEAVKWYLKAATQGNATAQYNLANHYAWGRGVLCSNEEAAKWYLEAANKGVLNAMNNLGSMYAIGRGVEKNESEAVKWFRKAAGQGDETALHKLQKIDA
ncbi:MAG: hypothetical protein LBT83_11380 [Tannerella sp.]|jgi:hypothetical protein|nr:hypothetical protein [Tannerella sp.]